MKLSKKAPRGPREYKLPIVTHPFVDGNMYLRHLPETTKKSLCMEVVERGTAENLKHLGRRLGRHVKVYSWVTQSLLE